MSVCVKIGLELESLEKEEQNFPVYKSRAKFLCVEG